MLERYWDGTLPIDPVRQRFIVAHELGHFLLGHENTKPEVGAVYSRSAQCEREANCFAVELLMPAAILRRHYASASAQSVEQLAQVFGVSTDAMGPRLMTVVLA